MNMEFPGDGAFPQSQLYQQLFLDAIRFFMAESQLERFISKLGFAGDGK